MKELLEEFEPSKRKRSYPNPRKGEAGLNHDVLRLVANHLVALLLHVPDVKLGEQSGKLTEDELNMFITHAYRKVLFLQQELAKQQTLEQERFKKALEKQRLETQMVATEKIESELERQKRDLELEHERRMAVIR